MMETLNLTLTKIKTYELKPFGKFQVKLNPSNKLRDRLDIIDFDRLSFTHESGMPYTVEDEKLFLKLMKKYKTDFFWDDYFIYTRIGSVWVEVKHPNLNKYKNFLHDNSLENDSDAWEKYCHDCYFKDKITRSY